MHDTFTGAHFGWSRPETVWRQLLRPWFEACSRIGWEPPHSADVHSDNTGAAEARELAGTSAAPMLLAPDAGMIAWIKGRLMAEGLGCLGVHFHTAGTLRGLLAQSYGVQGRIALREDLHLLMGQAARSLPDNPVAQAAALDPVALSRLCDRIDRAGWRAEGFSTAAGRQLAVRYFELLAAQGLRTVADLERELLKRAEKTPAPACGYLLAVGFGCEHSDSLLLLRAAALSARQPILCLDTGAAANPAATSAALSWQASCEEYFGLAQPLADGDEQPPAGDDLQLPADGDEHFAADGEGSDVGQSLASDVQTSLHASTAATPVESTQGTENEDDSLFQWAARSEMRAESASPLPPPASATVGITSPTSATTGITSPASVTMAASATMAASVALEAWAQALAAHSSVESGLRQPLQHDLRLLTFRTLDEEASHTVQLVRHWLGQSASVPEQSAPVGGVASATPAPSASGTLPPVSSGSPSCSGTPLPAPSGLASASAKDAALSVATVEGVGGSTRVLDEYVPVAPPATVEGVGGESGLAASPPPLRIGIVLPGDGSLLGREIAAGLSAHGIAHYDSLGHQPAPTPAQRLLESWCNWQNSNQIDDFNAFAAELSRQALLAPADLRHWERAVDKALSQTLCAELGVVAAFLSGVDPSPAAEQAGGTTTPHPATPPRAESGGHFQTVEADLPTAQDRKAPSPHATDLQREASAAAQTGVGHPQAEASTETSADAEDTADVVGHPQAEVDVETSSPSQLAVKALLANWPQLPEQASFEDFWAQTQPVLALLGWPQRPEALLERAAAFVQTLTGRLPRSAFIGWLRAVTRVPGRTRNPLGHEPFAQVHLVTLAEAGRQRWSHLCVVGMVHGQWPPLEADSALLDPERCAELNRRAERPSRFGEGQPCIGGSHTFLACARQHREAFEAAFLRLFGQCGAGTVALSRYRFEPSAQQAEAFASEYFLRSVYAATGSLDIGESAPLPAMAPASGGEEWGASGSAVGEAAASGSATSGSAAKGRFLSKSWEKSSAQVRATSESAEEDNAASNSAVKAGAASDSAIEAEAASGAVAEGAKAPASLAAYPQVALAYGSRRDPHSGFDAYSYALSSAPPEPLRLSCSHWAEVLNRPAHAWYRYVLKVRKRRRAADSDFRLQSQGIWVHHWLNPSAGRRWGEPPAFVPRPDAVQWQQQVATRALVLRNRVAAVYTRAGRQLPQWWQSDWSAAQAIAEAFAQTLGGASAGGGGIQESAGSASGIGVAGTGVGKEAEGTRMQGAGAQQENGGVPRSGQWSAAGGEWPLAPLRLDLPGHPLDGLVLEGIVDLLLAADARAADALASTATEPPVPVSGAPALWVVDYKTGADAALSLKSWESKGAGLQLVLYAFALRARGAGAVQMTMLRKNSALEPQLELDELSPDADIWHRLAIPMRDGVFGMRGLLRDPHSFSGDYPVATLGIDPVVLERKARLTLETK